ncbi:MAG: YceI family protein [Bacteriovoracaceae bacterium]
MRLLASVMALTFSMSLLAAKPTAKVEPILTQYQIDTSHGSLDFSIKHMMISNTKGAFKKWDGSFMFDKESGKLSDVKVNVDINSIDTKDEKRDGHLKGADFFDTAKFPSMAFVSNSVSMKAKKPSKIVGDLTIHGVTKPVTLNVDYLGSTKSMMGTDVVAFKGTTMINRKDFGLTWNKALELGGVAIGEEVSISFDFEAGPTNK